MATTSNGNSRKRAPAPLWSLTETTDFIGVSPSTFYKCWRRWGIPAYAIGRAIKFDENDVRRWLARHRAGEGR
jgi:excisionase family DNA binding protein